MTSNKISIQLNDQLYLIAFTINSGQFKPYLDAYNVLDSFRLNYADHTVGNIEDSLYIGDYVCFYTRGLVGDEEELILTEDHFTRPTRREPLIKGLYASLVRPNRELKQAAIAFLGDKHLNSVQGAVWRHLAGSCIGSTKYRMRHGKI